MQKAIITLCVILIAHYSGAQDSLPKRLNIEATYYAGIQFFNLNGLERSNNQTLKNNMPNKNGFFNRGEFGSLLLHQIEASGSVFKNKTWLIGINVSWGKDETSSYGYTIDADGNLAQYKSRMWYFLTFVGYSIKKNISFKKWGTLQPFITFFPQQILNSRNTITYEVMDKTTGKKISDGYKRGNHDYYNGFRYGMLMLFDNPKIGIDYSVKLYHHVCLNLRYSYWFADSMMNDFYGTNSRFVIPFHNSNFVTPFRSRINFKDMYSHNLSLGLSIQLRK